MIDTASNINLSSLRNWPPHMPRIYMAGWPWPSRPSAFWPPGSAPRSFMISELWSADFKMKMALPRRRHHFQAAMAREKILNYQLAFWFVSGKSNVMSPNYTIKYTSPLCCVHCHQWEDFSFALTLKTQEKNMTTQYCSLCCVPCSTAPSHLMIPWHYNAYHCY